MSYRVEYSSSGIKRTQIRQRNGRALLLTAVCFLIFLLIAGGFWPRGAQALREILLPGDSAVRAGAHRAGLPADARALAAWAPRVAPWRSYLTAQLWRAAAAPRREERPPHDTDDEETA